MLANRLARQAVTRYGTILFCACALAPIQLAAQISEIISAPPVQTLSREPHTVRGTVIDSVTRRPIARALVHLGEEQATFTDREGRFAFPEVMGEYSRLQAERPGYSMPRFAPNNQLSLYGPMGNQGAALPPEESVTIALVPEAIFSGTVTDTAGSPLVGISVLLHKSRMQLGMKRWDQAQQTSTNAEGEFRFADLLAGEYYLTTGAQLDSYFVSEPYSGYAPTRYPARGAKGVGDAFQLTAGQQVHVDLNLRLEKMYPVTGTVSGSKTLAGFQFSARNTFGEMIDAFANFFPRTNGFRMILPKGSYQINAEVYGQDLLTATSSLAVANAPLTNVSLNLVSPASIPIEIERESIGNEPENSAAEPNQWRPSLGLISLLGATIQSESYVQPGNGTPNGALSFKGLPPGRYVFTTQPNGPWHVTAATCGSTDLLRETISIAGGASGCTLHVVVSDASAKLAFAARTNDQPAAAWVYVIPIDNLALEAQQVFAAAEGATTTTLPAGRYDVLAFDMPQDIEYRNPEVMKRYAEHAKTVTMAAGQNATLQLDVIKTEQ